MESVLVLCAHPDDEVFGLGGTIAKYSKEGKKVVSIIFSYGEKALPYFKEEEVRKIRKKESLDAAKVMGTKNTLFLGLEEGKFEKAKKKDFEVIRSIILELKPSKIFTHSMDDPHMDHRATHKLVVDLLKDMDYQGELYAFNVWNPMSFRKRHLPKLFVDISDTFKIKIKAIRKFETQKMQGRWPLMPAIFARALVYGFQNKCKFAEKFLKVDFNS